MFHLNRWARDRDELRAAYEWEREVASLQALLTRDELAPSNIRCPPHPPSIAHKSITEGRICKPSDHGWIELEGYYWRECHHHRRADITVANLGQPVETPNASQSSDRGSRIEAKSRTHH